MIPGEVRAWIVRRLAAFERPKEIVQAVKDVWDLEVNEGQVKRLNPLLNDKLDESLVTLFWHSRRAFEEAVDDVGIGKKVFRLRELHRLYDESYDKGDIETCLSILDQASKEVGGVHERAGNVTLIGLGKFMEELSTVVAREIDDPEALARIEGGMKALPPPKG